MSGLQPARLLAVDIVRLAAYGLTARPLRVVLSALGIAIGIAAMLAVVGISTSSRAQLNQLLTELGTNLLSASPGTSLFGDAATMPPESVAMLGRIPEVETVSAIGVLADTRIYRSSRIPASQSGGLAVYAARLDLMETLSASVAAGSWLNAATSTYPAVVLGARAAARLGIGRGLIGQQVWLGGRWFTVVGILAPVSLVPMLDLSALIGWPAGERYLDFEGDITTLYVRTDSDAVETVRTLLAATANPEAPNEVDVSSPSDALAAEAAADIAFTGLLLGLGAVALLVGGIGVANTMVISVLERRADIGLRRSQGATRGHIRLQFFGEALLLALLGGGSGVLIGALVTIGYARLQGWPVDIPAWVPIGGMAATLLIGGVAGLYPAIRAARLAPTEALSVG
ncbi:MAG TPA: ABC transporter permease [Devosia sp.]|jgi:putative ABC transport system permease protein|uniref:ABC transporter permease n=1 Tax=Devosia sp. TaxID=1871048 RepID=UPI002DDCFA06|nr:ABC transporter permease [Devosia sp.]HEV2515753.1 ABC transporter permease [Devosia sp.]